MGSGAPATVLGESWHTADLSCSNSGNDSADITFPGTKCPLQLRQEKAEMPAPGGRMADDRQGLFGWWPTQWWMGQRLGPGKIKSQQGKVRPVANPSDLQAPSNTASSDHHSSLNFTDHLFSAPLKELLYPNRCGVFSSVMVKKHHLHPSSFPKL